MEGWKFLVMNEFLVPFLLCQALSTIIQCANAANSGFEDKFHLALKMRSKRNFDPCPVGWSSFGTKCYMKFGSYSSSAENWSSANQKCLDMNATLVSIHSREEHDFVVGLLSMASYDTWIGLREEMSSGHRVFYWSDNSPLDFLRWGNDQPNNWMGDKQECGEIWHTSGNDFGFWNDERCSKSQSYICQRPLSEITCAMKPCKNGALCYRGKATVKCSCAHGYTGLVCDDKILCRDNTCKNGGTCTQDGENGVFRCSCGSDYKGRICEQKVPAVPTGSKQKLSDTDNSDWHEAALYASLGVALAIASVVAMFFVIRTFWKPTDRNAGNWHKLRWK